MDALAVAWVVAMIVTIGALPVGLLRVVAYRSGEMDHTPTMRTAATFAVTLGLLGLVTWIGISTAILLR